MSNTAAQTPQNGAPWKFTQSPSSLADAVNSTKTYTVKIEDQPQKGRALKLKGHYRSGPEKVSRSGPFTTPRQKRRQQPEMVPEPLALDIDRVLDGWAKADDEGVASLANNPSLEQAVEILKATSTQAMRLATEVYNVALSNSFKVYAAFVRPVHLFNFDALIAVPSTDRISEEFECVYRAAEDAEDEARAMDITFNIFFFSVRESEDAHSSGETPLNIEAIHADGYVFQRLFDS